MRPALLYLFTFVLGIALGAAADVRTVLRAVLLGALGAVAIMLGYAWRDLEDEQ